MVKLRYFALYPAFAGLAIVFSTSHFSLCYGAAGISESWMGIYLQGSKIGYSVTQIKFLPPNKIKLENRLKMRLTMMGEEQTMVSNLSCITDTNFYLKSFDFSLTSRERSFSAIGNFKNGKLNLEIKSGGNIKKETRKITGQVYPASQIGTIALRNAKFEMRNLKFRYKVFDPTILQVLDAEVRIVGKEKVRIKNRDEAALKVEITMLGMSSSAWLDSLGNPLKEEAPPGVVMIRESPSEALAIEKGIETLDILSLFSVKTETLIPEPRNTKFLKVQISGIKLDDDLTLSDENQRVIKENPLILEINTKPNLISEFRIPHSAFKEWLKPSVCIQSDNPAIKSKATKIIGNKKGREAAEKLLLWVYNNIKKRATASLPSAIDVLKYLEGDCNEHSILYAAFCRAVGIPAKVVVGLVYLDNSFYYHSWNKIYLGEWVSVDPTFNQFPADATHIKLQEGELEEQAKVLKVVGNIKIKILEFN